MRAIDIAVNSLEVDIEVAFKGTFENFLYRDCEKERHNAMK